MYALLDLLHHLLLIFFLHLFPFSHNIINAQLTGDLLLYLLFLRNSQTDLSVIFLGKDIIKT